MKRALLVGAVGCLLAVVLAGDLASSGQPAKRPGPAETDNVIRDLIAVYFGNISQGKAGDNLKLFVREDVPFIGIRGGEGTEKVSQTKAADMVKEWQAAGAFDIAADSTHVERLDDALAVARVRYHTALITGRAVFTLTSEGGGWRIASVVYETRLK